MSNNGMYTSIVGAKHLDELRDKVQNIVIRRTEYEVSVQLPEVMITRVNCEKDSTQDTIMKVLSSAREELLEQYKNLIAKYRITNDQKDLDQATVIETKGKSLIAAAQAAATDPRMFLLSSSKMMQQQFGSLVPSTYKMSNKTEAILDKVEEIMEEDEKVIIFTKFKTSATMIADDIKSVLKQNVLMYTGKEDEDTREYAIQTFLNSTDHNILIGTEALAEGVNLQKAKYVINLDQPDTLAIKVQRIGRVRRVGSKFNNVIVYDMITEGSKDTERLENIERNGNLEGALIGIDEAQRQALLNEMNTEKQGG
jgi:superfamily II DNA/RNA helicase